MLAITDAKVLLPQEVRDGLCILMEDGRITGLCSPSDMPPGTQTYSADGSFVAPGFIDTHIHGGVGVDLMTASVDEISRLSEFLASHGVTSFLSTTVSAPRQDTDVALAVAKDAMAADLPGARMLGVHLEGPYLNPARVGAHREECLRSPNRLELDAWLDTGIVRVVTLAPELPGALELVALTVGHGAVASVGHSDATFEQAKQAFDAGMTRATHLHNSMRPSHHREPGVIGACLLDQRVACELILDGVHCHRSTCALTIAAKGAGRTILVTDGTVAVGMPDGRYSGGGQEILAVDGMSRTATGALVGSMITMEAAMARATEFMSVSFHEACQMASLAPATCLGLGRDLGSIAPGMRADLVALDASLGVRATFVGGRQVFQA